MSDEALKTWPERRCDLAKFLASRIKEPTHWEDVDILLRYWDARHSTNGGSEVDDDTERLIGAPRNKVLEEAAEVCEEVPVFANVDMKWCIQKCAAAIRALKGKP